MEVGSAYVAPGNATEEQLVKLWSEVLGMESQRIGIHDNFFSLGGHSLKLTRLNTRINQTFNLKMKLSTLFERPNIEEMAAEILSAVHTISDASARPKKTTTII
jgi:acyl carrier protein